MAEEKKAKPARKTKAEKEIRDGLLAQLKEKEITGKHFADLVDDYCAMWYAARLAEGDVRTRGIFVEYDNGGGQKGTRKNDSVDMLVKANGQMLRILAELGLKPVVKTGEDDGFKDV